MFENVPLKFIPYSKKVRKFIKVLSKSTLGINNTIYTGLERCDILSLIRLHLRELFNESIYKLRETQINVRLANNTKKTVSYFHSQYHFEISIKEHKIPDIYMITNVINSLVSSGSINQSIKIIVIRNADHMSKISQFALRRIMEVNHKTSRFFLECNSLNSIDYALISRCNLFRVPLPKNSHIQKYIEYITQNNKLITNKVIKKILKKSNRSIRKAVFYIDIYSKTKKIPKINSKKSLITFLYKLTISNPTYSKLYNYKRNYL